MHLQRTCKQRSAAFTRDSLALSSEGLESAFATLFVFTKVFIPYLHIAATTVSGGRFNGHDEECVIYTLHTIFIRMPLLHSVTYT